MRAAIALSRRRFYSETKKLTEDEVSDPGETARWAGNLQKNSRCNRIGQVEKNPRQIGIIGA